MKTKISVLAVAAFLILGVTTPVQAATAGGSCTTAGAKAKIGKNDYHLDHKYSIYEGFKNNVDPLIMASKENLEVIPSKINLSKQNRCSISLDELFKLTEYLFKKQ